MTDHRSCIDNSKAVEFKPEQNSGLNGIRTHALCGTGAVLYRLHELTCHLEAGQVMSS